MYTAIRESCLLSTRALISRCWDIFGHCVVVLISILSVALAGVALYSVDASHACPVSGTWRGLAQWLHLSTVFVSATVGVLYRLSATRVHWGMLYIVAMWLYAAMMHLKELQVCTGTKFFVPTTGIIYGLKGILGTKMLVSRFQMLEQTMECSLGSGLLNMLTNSWIVVHLTNYAVWHLVHHYGTDYPWSVETLISMCLPPVVWVCAAKICCAAKVKLRKIVALVSSDALVREATLPCEELNRQLMGYSLVVLLTMFRHGWFLQGARIPKTSLEVGNRAIDIVDQLADVSLFVLLTGMHRALDLQVVPWRDCCKQRERRLRDKDSAGRGEWQDDALWAEQVEDLANRGVTLRCILIFWRGLGKQYMLHFKASLHTTTDVVRQAVIPLTSEEKCAMAHFFKRSGYNCMAPQKFVTHVWSNLFRDTLAAIFANALGERDFFLVAALLESDVDKLESLLDAQGALDNTVWACFFAVNQHKSICHRNPNKDRDPVTAAEHAICLCSNPKFLNDTAPTRCDGKSYRCEMNKFDDVMSALSQQGVEHIVAVDSSFTVFSRAWCAAEFVVSYQLGLKLSLVVPFRELVLKQRDFLSSLKVQTMSASRPEDRNEILEKVRLMPGGEETFNEKLQVMLLHPSAGCLPSWDRMDSMGRMLHPGRLVRWTNMVDNPEFWLHVEQLRKLALTRS